MGKKRIYRAVQKVQGEVQSVVVAVWMQDTSADIGRLQETSICEQDFTMPLE